MSEDTLLLSSIGEARRLLDTGELSPVELTGMTLDRIQRFNPELRAFTHVAEESALASARDSARRLARGEPRGPLDGIPVSVKDIIAVAGLPLEAGSQVLRGNVEDRDATVVRALRRTGAVIVGKTALDEFALTTSGPAVNPLDPSLTAGGSSCGSASAVRAGLSFADVATDTGGSVRIPAHCCGAAGLKPTHGLLPLDGVLPLASTLDHVGTLTRTATDSAAFLAALLPGIASADRPGDTVRRVGVPRGLTIHSAEVARRFDAAIAHITSTGAEAVEVTLPDLDEVAAMHMAILGAEMAAYHHDRFGAAEGRYGIAMRTVLAAGAQVTGAGYRAALRTRGRIRAEVDRLFDTVDLLALPTLLIDTPKAGQQTVTVDGTDQIVTPAMVRLTSLFDHTGHPAISLSITPTDRPDSIQLVAPHFAEDRLLTAAAAFSR
ncbi:amidase [Pseudonocardia spinosispora]|uniref:amidase n=1 Tax=Pseudonocardia spinosispora TaxID=103441 RepID=UPI00040CEA7D|nr:amidase [Pseudonocardia spinosispora]